MKSFVAFSVISVLVAVVIAGPAFSMYFGEHGAGKCLASLAERADCPSESGLLAAVAFHFGAIHGLTETDSASFGQFAPASIFIALGFIFTFGLLASLSKLKYAALSIVQKLKRAESTTSFSRVFLSWFSIYERSPAVAS
jgi:hypothetical protein